MTKLIPTVVSFAIASSVSVLLLSGCGEGGPPALDRYKVTGKVTLDGRPLESGRISFIDPNGGGDGGEIKNGSFTVQATEGTKRVEIVATRESDKNVEGKSEVKQSESIIPEKYNAKSTLTAEISADEPNEAEFPLESAP